MGATIALPHLDAMLPAFRPFGSSAAAAANRTRVVCIESVHGAAGSNAWGASKNLWAPAKVGRDFELIAEGALLGVLQVDQGALWTRNLDALSRGGITRKTFKTNIGEIPDETDDVYYRPINLTVVNAKEMPPDLPEDKPAVTNTTPDVALPPLQPRNARTPEGNGSSGGGATVADSVPVEAVTGPRNSG